MRISTKVTDAMTEQNSPPPRGGYWDLRPDVAVSPEPPPASSTQTTEKALRARLAALDHLYESNAITRTQLSEGRNAILGGRVSEGRASLIGADASLVLNGAAPHAQTLAALEAGPSGPAEAALVVAPAMPSVRRRA
jgi:hypothetical protein